MKKITLLLVFASLGLPVFAQFSIGLTAGVSQSYWKWDFTSQESGLDGIDYEPALGWRSALLGEWKISPLLGLRAEVATQVKGRKIDVLLTDDTGGNETPAVSREGFQHWEGGIIFQVSPVKKYRHAYLLAGCTAGRITNVWRKISPQVDGKQPIKRDVDMEEAFLNRKSIAADFGLGVNIPIGAANKLKIEGRYQHGLLNLCTSDRVDAGVNSLFLSVGYLHAL